MFCKLAVQNVRKSLRDYLIYFLTLLFGVCIFYIFNSLDSQQVMLDMSSLQNSIITVLIDMLGVLSVFVSLILACLILYANKFMIKRRKKELGIYMTLGMPKGKISAILLLETLIIGFIALFAGLILGIFLSQGLSVITAQLFDVRVRDFHFILSTAALLKTLVYFGIIFLVVMIFNSLTISRCKLIDLFYAEKKNESLKIKKIWVSVALFLVAVALLVAAYCMILHNGIYVFDYRFFLTLALGTVGTLLFFMSLSGFLLRVVKLNKRIYYKGLNIFVLRQINSKINTTYVSMSVICIMLMLTISILATSAGFNTTAKEVIDKNAPYDVTYVTQRPTDSDPGMPQILKDAGIDSQTYFRDMHSFSLYECDALYESLLRPYDDILPDTMADWYLENPLWAIRLSDYNRLLKMQGKDIMVLGDGEFGLASNINSMMGIANRILKEGSATITIGGVPLTVADIPLQTAQPFNASNPAIDLMLILPDHIDSGLTAGNHIFAALFNGDPETTENQLMALQPKIDAIAQQYGVTYYSMSAIEVYEISFGMKSAVVFVGIYLGIIFLIASAAVLALQQLSETSDNVSRYRLLRKLGVEQGMMSRSLLIQIAIYFLLPLLLAITHAAVALTVMQQAIEVVAYMNASTGIFLTALFLIVIYGGYFCATYLSCRSIIRNRRNEQET